MAGSPADPVLRRSCFVQGRDAWCQLNREDAAALLPGYDDESNNAYLHIRLL